MEEHTVDATEELQKSAEELRDLTKGYNRLLDQLSSDDKVAQLAKAYDLSLRILRDLKMTKIKKVGFPTGKPIRPCGRPRLAAVRPCGERFGGKTYLAFYVGDAALSSSVGIEEDRLVCGWSFYNPMLYIPATGDVVYGAESWWGDIESPEQLRQISDADIADTWYVKLAQELLEKKAARPDAEEADGAEG